MQHIISSVSVYKLSVQLKQPFITSLGFNDAAKNIVVKICTTTGITGFGECSPYMAINGESQETCFAVGKMFAQILKGKDAADIKQCIAAMDKLIYGNTSIKSAFDIALFDIAAHAAGLPLYTFLGGNNEKTIVTDYTVSIGEPEQMAMDAVAIQAAGFPAIKVKLGSNGNIDVMRIAAIREAVGNTIPIRIDANQGWSVKEAIKTLQALAPFNIEHCEEPIARHKFMQLKKVKKHSPIPIMADECCGDEHDAKRLIRLKACDYMNIKLGKCGGIYKGLKMVKLAEKAVMPLQVGAMLESRLAMTAFAHFALCSKQIVHFDFDTCLMFSEDPVTGGLQYEQGGLITLLNTPGLGASIDESILSSLEQHNA